jgi:hypothetical protein
MPIVDVTYGPRLGEDAVRRLAAALPHAVSLAVECPEEPYDGDLRPGDVELRFHARGPFDPGGLDVVVQVHSKWTESRAADRDARCARLRDAIAEEIGDRSVGVYLALPVAGWAQTDLG